MPSDQVSELPVAVPWRARAPLLVVGYVPGDINGIYNE